MCSSGFGLGGYMGLVRASRPSWKVGTLEADLREDEDGKPRPARAERGFGYHGEYIWLCDTPSPNSDLTGYTPPRRQCD